MYQDDDDRTPVDDITCPPPEAVESGPPVNLDCRKKTAWFTLTPAYDAMRFRTGNFTNEATALSEMAYSFGLAVEKRALEKLLEGKSGWDNPKWLYSDIIRHIIKHTKKGDMLDVAVYVMFAWNRWTKKRKK